MAPDDARRARILLAAERLFSPYRIRRTSMELLAAEAGVAKPTLYAYFGSKEQLFRAVVQELILAVLDEAAAVASARLPVQATVQGILEAKFTRMHELVFSSPHAAELLASSDAQARDIAAEGDRQFRGILADVLRAAQTDGQLALVGLTTDDLADALMVGGHGASWNAASVAEHRRNIAMQVRLLLAGVTPPVGPASASSAGSGPVLEPPAAT